MLIGIDARELAGRPTGVGRYLFQLLDAWRTIPRAHEHRFELYSAVPIDTGALWDSDAKRLAVSTSVIPGSPGSFWEQVRLPAALRQRRPDVLFAPAYTSPLLAGIPTVQTVHDVSFVAHPEWFHWREGLRRRWLTRLSARRARLVLTDAEFSKREIVERLGVARERVRVIPLGVEVPASVRPPDGPPPPEPIVLYVGSIFNRRRVPDLLAAFAELVRTHPDARLEIVGENRSYPRQDLAGIARSMGMEDRVNVRSYVSDEVLAGLYARASVFAFLSEYEGFGLTPLEALSAGVPIVVLESAVARETYGDAAWYVQKDDITGAATALARLMFDPDTRSGLLARASPVLRRYSWSESARRTLEALEEAAGLS